MPYKCTKNIALFRKNVTKYFYKFFNCKTNEIIMFVFSGTTVVGKYIKCPSFVIFP